MHSSEETVAPNFSAIARIVANNCSAGDPQIIVCWKGLYDYEKDLVFANLMLSSVLCTKLDESAILKELQCT